MNLWYIMNDTADNLWHRYLKEYPEAPIGKQTFTPLMPFYVRSATPKDLVMCVCAKSIFMHVGRYKH